MPERLNQLRQTLADLEAELAGVDQLDAETRQKLADAAGEITGVLNRSRPSEPASVSTSTAAPSLVDRLNEQAQVFEASHPNLSAAIYRMVNALGQIGI